MRQGVSMEMLPQKLAKHKQLGNKTKVSLAAAGASVGAIPQVVICCAFCHQVVDAHGARLANTVYPILCLNQHL